MLNLPVVSHITRAILEQAAFGKALTPGWGQSESLVSEPVQFSDDSMMIAFGGLKMLEVVSVSLDIWSKIFHIMMLPEV